MSDPVVAALGEILSTHGDGIISDPRRLNALLNDAVPSHRRERLRIAAALDDGLAADLANADRTRSADLLLDRLASRLERDRSFTTEAARWTVEAWAFALGIEYAAGLSARQPLGPLPDSRPSGGHEDARDPDRVLASSPDDVGALVARGRARRDDRRYVEALADLDRALEVAPGHTAALCHRGETYRRIYLESRASSDLDRALADLERTLELEPGNVLARRWWRWARASVQALEARQHERAGGS